MINKIILTAITKTGKTVSFRYPTINDVQILTDYINKLSKEKTFITFQGEIQTLDKEKKYVNSCLEKINNNEAVHILAFIDKNLVGYSDINLRGSSQDHIGNFGITVAKNYRGEGIGSILFNIVYKEAQKKISKLRILTLSVLTANKLAYEWYKRNNFIEYGRLPEGIKRKNIYEEIIFMYKRVT